VSCTAKKFRRVGLGLGLGHVGVQESQPNRSGHNGRYHQNGCLTPALAMIEGFGQ
jgi:hypothetical protein